MGILTILTLLLSALALPLALACGVAGVLHLRRARHGQSRAAGWWGATWMATGGAFLTLGLPSLSAVVTGQTPPDFYSSPLPACTALSAILFVVTAQRARAKHSRGRSLWLLAFLLLLLPWIGMALGYLFP